MRNYRSEKWSFSIQFPEGWKEPGFIRKAIFNHFSNPEFYGPDGATIKFAVGPISPQPSAEKQKDILEYIATKHGHEIIYTDTMEVNGSVHAIMVVEIPLVGRVKNYSLIFRGIEYFVTAKGNFNITDKIVNSFVI